MTAPGVGEVGGDSGVTPSATPPVRLGAVPSLDALVQDPAKVSTLPPEVAATLASEAAERKSRWEALAMALWVRALAGTTTPVNAGHSLISIEAAARKLAVSPDWIYRRSKGDRRLPFLARVGGKLLCSSQALDRYIQQRLSR